jgi:hypothetical protein
MIAETIVAALLAGSATGATDAAKKAVADAYAGLKSLIQKKFGGDSEAAVAIDKLEKDPNSEGRKMILGEELQKAGANELPDLLAAAQTLRSLLEALPKGDTYNLTATGDRNIQVVKGTVSINNHGKF